MTTPGNPLQFHRGDLNVGNLRVPIFRTGLERLLDQGGVRFGVEHERDRPHLRIVFHGPQQLEPGGLVRQVVLAEHQGDVFVAQHPQRFLDRGGQVKMQIIVLKP